jgi:molybdenum cofactor sulfurtransferase
MRVQRDGTVLPLSFVSHCAAAHKISLRTGCMCNPGGAAAMLGLGELMTRLGTEAVLPSMGALEQAWGRELGVVRVSLGLASNFQDVWRVLEWARMLSDENMRRKAYVAWIANVERERVEFASSKI